jgi:hypothetical protein
MNYKFSFLLLHFLCLFVISSVAFDFFDIFEKASSQDFGRENKQQATETDNKRT